MSSKDRFVGVIYSDDYSFEYDAQPKPKCYSEEEDSYVRILESRTIVHHQIEDERDHSDKDFIELDWSPESVNGVLGIKS